MTNYKMKFVKSAAALALGASVITSAVVAGDLSASAKTTYKVSKGKLVNAKTKKAIKGYKVYKSVLYKNGKKFTGTYKAKYYKAGTLFTGLVGKTYYKKGVKATATYKGVYYKAGKAFTGTKSGYYYKNGTKFNGTTTAGYYYINGKRAEGVKEVKGIEVLYKNGKVVADKTAPVITIDGQKDGDKIELKNGAEFATPKASVKDNVDSKVKVVTEIKDQDGKVVDAIDPKVAGTYTITYAAKDASENASAVSITVVVGEADPAVESVIAINATTVEVKFTKAVDETSAKGAVSIEGVTFDTETLSEDGKTLTLTSKAAIDAEDAKLVVKQVLLKDSTTEKTPKYTTLFTYKDTVAPTAVSAKSEIAKVTDTNTKTVTVKFSEPVQSSAIAYVNDENATVSQNSANKDELILTTTKELKAGDAVEIKLTNVKDLAGNTINPNPATVSTTVADADKTAPVVTDVTTYENKVTFTFDKEVETAEIDNTKTYLATGFTKVGTLTNPQISSNKKSVTYTVAFETGADTYDTKGTVTTTLYTQEGLVTDKAGNKVAATEKSVTLTKDVVAPTLATSEYKDGKLVLAFDEDVVPTTDAKLAVVETNAVTGATKAKNSIALTDASVTKIEGKKVTIDVSASAEADTKGEKTYKLSFAKGAFTDDSAAKNPVAAFSKDITVAKAAAPAPVETKDTKAPTVDLTKTTVDLKDGNYVISYDVEDQADASKGETASALDFASLRNTANYTLAGKALPEGSVITTTADDVNATSTKVNITIPKSAVKTTIEGVLTVTGLKDAKGNTATEIFTTENKLKLAEGVAPIVKSAIAVLESGSVVTATSTETALDFTLAKDSITSLIKVNFDEEITPLDSATKVFVTLNGTDFAEYGKVELSTDAKTLTITPTNAAVGTMSDKPATFVLATNTTDVKGSKVTKVADVNGNELTIPTITVTPAK